MTAPTSSFSATFLTCMLWRTIQGLAVALSLTLLVGNTPDSWPVPAASMGLAGVLIGLGIGVAADRWLRTRFSGQAAIQLAALPLLSGVWLMYALPQVEAIVCVCVWVGIGVGGEWSTLADACRGELTARTRWRGILLWTVMFAAGTAIACVLPPSSAAMLTVSLVVTLATTVLLSRNFRFIREPVPATAEQLAAEVAGFAAAQAAADGVPLDEIAAMTAESEDDGCDATDCCGGSKPVAPTSFSQGVLLVTVAWTLLLATLSFVLSGDDTLAERLPCFAGLIAGCLLMFTTAPRTGYAVALLPFLLLLPVMLLLHPFFAAPSVAKSLLSGGLCLAVAGLHTGLRLVAGESFADCASDPVRTRVHVVGLFAAAAVVLIEACLRMLLPAGGWQAVPLLILAVAGLAVLRTLPAPVVSSLGKEEASPDPDELQDVMAIVNEQV
ncbi:MAG: hypothetical protein NXI04_20870 [Planctomycetaceae bacterium]|nr:hypothetical protein [Planctomycetaceae bacterium]